MYKDVGKAMPKNIQIRYRDPKPFLHLRILSSKRPSPCKRPPSFDRLLQAPMGAYSREYVT